MKLKTKIKIRKTNRYLGLFLGIQFLFWTVSGLYFSWTDLDEIHGDHFKNIPEIKAFSNLISPSEIQIDSGISSIEIREIILISKTYYFQDSLVKRLSIKWASLFQLKVDPLPTHAFQ